MSKPKLLTILGTRPEIIRLSRIIPKLDAEFDHVLVHTGQNFDAMLSEVFFEELEIRRPDYFFNSKKESLAKTLADILVKTEDLISEIKPQGFFVLGDTNSALASIIARRMQIPVYHWEAGNRSFDENVPEETNRKIVDHVAHFNIAYSSHAENNLLREGVHPDRILISGSPMKEILEFYKPKIEESKVLEVLGLKSHSYFVASLHRQENVDSQARLTKLLDSLLSVHKEWNLPVLISTHPRTNMRLNDLPKFKSGLYRGLLFHSPFGYFDFMKLQSNSTCVISDSGTVSEESAILDFPAITIRDSMERPEALEAGTIKMVGLGSRDIIDGVYWAISSRSKNPPSHYLNMNAASEVVALIKSTISNYEDWSGVRKLL